MAKRWHRTLDTHLGAHTPCNTDYLYDDTWDWDSWRVGYKDPSVLFTTLHAEYNTLKCAIQDPKNWHSDVSEIARTANNKDEFLTLLKKRQEQRFDEIQTAWQKTIIWFANNPLCEDNPPDNAVLWEIFLQFSNHFSYDCLVRYFGSYTTVDQPSTRPLPPNAVESRPAKPPQAKRKGKGKGKMAKSSGVIKSSSRASKAKPKRDDNGQGGVRRSTRLQQRAEQS
ncbi:uncharacterized protein N7479_004125 [Penicillium vulpinum]|uniref:Uncharacterized protein n=1 Tax=Penicillium vulpinum TaxID=29845 RepID=A0A1V6SCE7_9EURO|nr:uncharacterized protein N7479_004125 [Penicillium vulpinum]KAJ5964249.1 hypothetical protein N7479_004125 [Penicillium vulpinum]OQE11677.1 hypothetical protein PENVUL_c002G01484 [Penicillium vulpinum]